MRHAILFCAVLLAVPAWAAEAPPKLIPLPEIPPPPGMVDPSLEPQITLREGKEGRIEEYRIRGRLYMIKVTPAQGRPYYLVDSQGDGQMKRWDDLSPDFKVPMWVIGTF
jgi:hypothetical protein